MRYDLGHRQGVAREMRFHMHLLSTYFPDLNPPFSQYYLDVFVQFQLAAWTNERFSHDGRFWHFEDVPIYPRPVQQPTPPIWVAGHSPDSLGFAGRHGFNVMTVAHPFPPEHYVPGLAAWREGLTQNGLRPGDRHCKLHLRVWVDENAER